MTLPRRRRNRPRGRARLALTGDFPETGESVTEILERVKPAGYDGTTWPGTGWQTAPVWPGPAETSPPEDPDAADNTFRPPIITGTDDEQTGPATEPITRWQPAPATFPALPAGDSTPADRYGRPPRTPRPADAAMYVRTKDGPGLECGLCRWRRHTDPAVPDAPYMFDALREFARTAGWRPDAVGRWICPKCQHSPLYWPLRAARHCAPRVRQAKKDGQHISPDVEFDFEVIAEQAALERLHASRARTAMISRGDGRSYTARIVAGNGGNYQGRRRAGAR